MEFLDRAIPVSVAARAGLTEEAVRGAVERARTGMDRLVWTLARVSNPTTATGLSVERVEVEERWLRAEIEELLVRACDSGGVCSDAAATKETRDRHAG